MKLIRILVPTGLAAALLLTGCAQPRYYGPPPPPAYGGPSMLVQRAEHEGFQAGAEDGARDLNHGFGYHPRRDRRFHNAPGYDPALGPFGPYRDAFRGAYLRGYDIGFNHR